MLKWIEQKVFFLFDQDSRKIQKTAFQIWGRNQLFRAKRGRRLSGTRNWGSKKKRYDDYRANNFVPGQTIHFLVEVFAFLSLFQPLNIFSYVFHFHNLSKRHSEKTFFEKKFSEKKTKQIKLIHFFFQIFFLCPKPTQHIFFSILL